MRFISKTKHLKDNVIDRLLNTSMKANIFHSKHDLKHFEKKTDPILDSRKLNYWVSILVCVSITLRNRSKSC